MNDVEKTPTVFIIEQRPVDYSPASVYGKLQILQAGQLAPDLPTGSTDWNSKVSHALSRELADYVPGYDFIVPTGAPARMMLVAMIIKRLARKHKLLVWDDRTQRYLIYTLDTQGT